MFGHRVGNPVHGTVTDMVTRIHGARRGRYYIKEHWKASGLSREYLAGQLGMVPESVSRMVAKADNHHKIATNRLYQLAEIFQVSVDELRLPPRPKDQPKLSVDDLLKDEPDDVKLKAVRMIEVMIGRKSA